MICILKVKHVIYKDG